MNQNRIIPQTGDLTPEKARLIARLIGDGAVYLHKHDYIMKYEVVDEDSLQDFAKDMKKVYGLKAKRWMNTSGKTGRKIPFLVVRCKEAFEDLLKYTKYASREWAVPKQVFSAKTSVKVEFLRTLYDDEGSVVEREIRLYSINEKGLKQVKTLLKGFGIPSYLRGGFGMKRNVFGLIISKKYMPLFSSKIGFSLKRKSKKLESLLSKQVKVRSASGS